MITFIQPVALLALLVLPPLWLLACVAQHATVPGRAGHRRPRRLAVWLGLLLPTVAIICLTGALAGAQMVVPEPTLTVVFVLDESDSVAPAAREYAQAYLRNALAALPTGDRAGLVVFGQRAEVARLPSDDRTLAPIALVPNGSRTDIAGALQLALAMLPNEGRRRLVVLSDGNQNMGDALQAAQIAATHGVALDVVLLTNGPASLDVQISGLDLPGQVRQGQQLHLTIHTSAPSGVPARLVVSSNDVVLVDMHVQVAAGRSDLEVELPNPARGFNRYTVRLDVAGDTHLQNNRAETFTIGSGPPQVLLVAPSPEVVRPLQAALGAATVTVDVIRPAALPMSLDALSRYDAIMLVNVPLNALPAAAETLLPAYVRDLGRGLAMIGGPRSLGAGGYRASAIEAALPVTMDPRPTMQAPPAAIVVLLDVSGSMSEYAGDATKLQLAAQGAMAIGAQLRDDDALTIVPFDGMERGTIGPIPGSDRATVPERLRTLAPGAGGINLFDGLQAARRYLDRDGHNVRHLIVLTDGNDTAQKDGTEGVVRALNAAGTTVTIIAVGDGRDVPFVKNLARLGGGRFFLSHDAISLPKIMADEARLVLSPYVIDGPFAPAVTAAANDSALLHPIGDLPILEGYVASQPKMQATVLLVAAHGDPLLAIWQYGLGHSLVWTSDLIGQWSDTLVQSPQFPVLAAQMVSWLLPPSQAERLSLNARGEGDTVLLTATTADGAGHTLSGLHVVGHMFAADGRERSIGLREIAPGIYSVRVPQLDSGSYAVDLVASNERGELLATTTGGAVLANTSEYGEGGTNQPLLNALAAHTGGRVDPLPTQLFTANGVTQGRAIALGQPLLVVALCLLPLTVLVRRLRFQSARRPMPVDALAGWSVLDRIWFRCFGNLPLHATRQRRQRRRSEQQAWGAWIHNQAQQVSHATEEFGEK